MVIQLSIVRMIANDINVFEIVFFRALFSCLFVLPIIASNPAVLKVNRPFIMTLCAALAFVAGVCFYFAAKYMPLADITAIHFSRPIFAAILAAIVLKEVIRGPRAIAIIGGFIGLIIGAYLLTYYNESIMGADEKKASNIAKSTTWGYVISKSMKSLLILIFIFYLMI